MKIQNLLLPVLVLAALFGRSGYCSADTTDKEAIDKAIRNGCKYLLSRIDKDGRVTDEYSEKKPRFGTRTAMTVYTLLRAGIDHEHQQQLLDAVQWILKTDLKGTYPVSYRSAALSVLKDERALKQLKADTKWLMRAMSPYGAYADVPIKPGVTEYDNDNSYIAAFGIQSAAARGVEIPLPFWKLIEQHWLGEQQSDGGWGFCLYRGSDGKKKSKTYGTMTAAGIAALSNSFVHMRRQDIINCNSPANYAAVTKGLKWLASNISVTQNPMRNEEGYYKWMFLLQNVGEITGRRHLGNIDWYNSGAAELVRRQHHDGGWCYGNRTEATCYAVLFLISGYSPTWICKANYPGRWNTRPRDASNLARWLSYTYEKPMGWQLIDLNGDNFDPEEGRILYLSGAGPVVFTDKQIQRIRAYVQNGGLLLTEAACDNGDFTLDMYKMYQKIFPRYRLRRIDPNHHIYNLQYKDMPNRSLMGVTNGIRLLAIHAPEQISLAMELGISENRRKMFNLQANVYLYLTDMSSALRGARMDSVSIEGIEPAGTVYLARLKHEGNWDPEPMAMQYVSGILNREFNIRLKTKAMDITDLDAEDWPVAYITGTRTFTLGDGEKKALKRYLDKGGRIIADAAGGSAAFGKSFEELTSELVGKMFLLPRVSGIYQKPYNLKRIRYRRSTARLIPEDQRRIPRLKAVYMNHRPVIVYSADDLCGGLVGYPLYGMKGYTFEDSRKIMINLLSNLTGTKMD